MAITIDLKSVCGFKFFHFWLELMPQLSGMQNGILEFQCSKLLVLTNRLTNPVP